MREFQSIYAIYDDSVTTMVTFGGSDGSVVSVGAGGLGHNSITLFVYDGEDDSEPQVVALSEGEALALALVLEEYLVGAG